MRGEKEMDQTGMLALILILVLAAFALYRIWKGKRKRKDHQKQLSRIGNFGEARLRSNLSDIPEPKRILRHLYLPVGNGDQTTEIDLLMIHRTGIYVFESKNYSGYVKGKERKKGSHTSQHASLANTKQSTKNYCL